MPESYSTCSNFLEAADYKDKDKQEEVSLSWIHLSNINQNLGPQGRVRTWKPIPIYQNYYYFFFKKKKNSFRELSETKQKKIKTKQWGHRIEKVGFFCCLPSTTCYTINSLHDK